MEIKQHEFCDVIINGNIMEAIFITGYNLKLVYHELHEKGCKVFPDDTLSYGYIWLYNNKNKICKSYTQKEFNMLILRSI